MATKIFLHIPDDYACTNYRAEMPYLHLFDELSRHDIHITGSSKTLTYELFDVYIFNRLIRPEFYQNVVNPLLQMGKKIVWQSDDDLWSIPEWNPARNLLSNKDLESLNLYIKNANSLWVSTDKLAELVGYPEKTKVLPNLIDLNHFDKKVKHSKDGPIKIVWCGSSSHDGDLEQIIEPVIEVLKKHKNVAMIFWGYLPTALAKFERQPGFPHANLVPKYENLFFGEWFSHREYFYKLRDLKPDIAIMPLSDCVFNYSKSNLKYLEMSMAGAACVATNLPPYHCIENRETGLLVDCNNKQGWVDALDELITNAVYRQYLNEKARDQIHQKYTWRSPARQLWSQAFQELAF